ncbi:RNA ligase [compost metagenome]
MEFRKFESLENTYNAKMKHYVEDQCLDTGLWVVTEKVDGANFAFYYDGAELKIASRNQFVDGTFFACQEVVDRYKEAVIALYERILPSGGEMILYGELYGPNVQGRVNYGAKNFIGFDIVANGEAFTKLSVFSFLRLVGIPHVPILFIGEFNEAWEHRHEFDSYLTPKDHPHEVFNQAEGITIEPVVPTYFESGKRVYFKHKTEAFSEMKAPKKVKVEPDVPEDVADMLDRISPYLSESRVHSVISKIGEVGKGDFGKVLKLTVQDAMEDFEKEFEVSVGRILQGNTAWLIKLLSKEATPVVRPAFLSHI